MKRSSVLRCLHAGADGESEGHRYGGAELPREFIGETLPESEYMEMLRGNAATQMDLTVLKQHVQQLDNQCVKELRR